MGSHQAYHAWPGSHILLQQECACWVGGIIFKSRVAAHNGRSGTRAMGGPGASRKRGLRGLWQPMGGAAGPVPWVPPVPAAGPVPWVPPVPAAGPVPWVPRVPPPKGAGATP